MDGVTPYGLSRSGSYLMWVCVESCGWRVECSGLLPTPPHSSTVGVQKCLGGDSELAARQFNSITEPPIVHHLALHLAEAVNHG